MTKPLKQITKSCKNSQLPALRNILIPALFVLQAASTALASQPDTGEKLQQAIEKLHLQSGPPGSRTQNSKLTPLSLIQQSLWQRLRNNFELNDLDHPTIERQVKFMQKGLYSLGSNLQRATPYLYFIVDEIDRANLPIDIALLPLVESAFDPHAKSSQGAVGLWQFIPATARDYGLTLNKAYDGRKDIVASTHAATRYLKQLHKTFDGDWLLALAAYNTGPGNVRSAMRRASQQGLEPSFWNLKLAKETRDYVPRLIAVTKMVTSPEVYGLKLPVLANRKMIDTIAVGRPMQLKRVAQLANIPLQQLESLNPGYLNGAIPQGGPYDLTLPSQASRDLLTELNRHKLSTPAGAKPTYIADFSDSGQQNSPVNGDKIALDIYKPFKKYVYGSHTVQRGDNLWDISKEMKTDVATLRAWNGRTANSAKLQPGDEMMVALIDEEKKADIDQILINYRVQAHDTLISITDKFQLSVVALKKWNPAIWQKNHVQTGQLLRIPVQLSGDL